MSLEFVQKQGIEEIEAVRRKMSGIINNDETREKLGINEFFSLATHILLLTPHFLKDWPLDRQSLAGEKKSPGQGFHCEPLAHQYLQLEEHQW